MNATPPAERLAARYRLLERLADGGMASVWKAHDEVLAREVAVKILHEDLARDAAFLERFRQEAVAAARLSHPRIVRIFDTGTDGDRCFIVMELFHGQDLGTVIARGPMEPSRAAWIVSCALEGLGHAHEQGLIHRDVKPGNILVGDEGSVKVTDFGVAKAVADVSDLTTTGTVLGTVRYLSPEQVQGHPLDARSDLYSTGVVLYEALTGRPPFDADSHLATATMRLTEPPLAPRAVRGGIPRELERVTLRALAVDPDERFASAEEMRRAIGRALGETTGELRPVSVARAAPPPATTAGRRQPSTFRSWMLVPLVLLVLTALVVAGGLLFGRLELGGPLGVRPKQDPGPTFVSVAIAGATAFDPPPGDGQENSAEIGRAVDGDPATTWTTERYDSADLGRLKDGVGVVVDLGAEANVTEIQISSPTGGWTFQIRDADDPAHALDAASARPNAAGQVVFEAVEGTTILEMGPFQARSILIWITGLVPDGSGYRAEITDVVVLEPE